MLIYLLFFSTASVLIHTFTDRDKFFSSIRQNNDPAIYNGTPIRKSAAVSFQKAISKAATISTDWH
jgi:hypothetical protein